MTRTLVPHGRLTPAEQRLLEFLTALDRRSPSSPERIQIPLPAPEIGRQPPPSPAPERIRKH